MLESIYIDNFRSIRTAAINLQKVNLFIGPNNSGKSNFLKAIEFFGESLHRNIEPDELFSNFFKKQGYELGRNSVMAKGVDPIKIVLSETHMKSKETDCCIINYFGYSRFTDALLTSILIGKAFSTLKRTLASLPVAIQILALENIKGTFEKFILWDNYHNGTDFTPFLKDGETPSPHYSLKYSYHVEKGEVIAENINATIFNTFLGAFWEKYKFIRIYKPEPLKMMMPFSMKEIKNTETIDADIFNIIPFLDTMQRKHHKVFKYIEEDLKRFTPEFESIAFDIVEVMNGGVFERYMKFGLKDSNDQIYWAEELSEGLVYFIGLLAIIHQPQPPALLMLEEPEKGIHPRRIKEVIQLIFDLAYEKNIQVIITTHSTIVVDQFENIPESVFVFEMHDEVTSVKNLKTDIIEPSNEKLKAKGFEPITYTNGLGEHWAMGFLGGVPA